MPILVLRAQTELSNAKVGDTQVEWGGGDEGCYTLPPNSALLNRFIFMSSREVFTPPGEAGRFVLIRCA